MSVAKRIAEDFAVSVVRELSALQREVLSDESKALLVADVVVGALAEHATPVMIEAALGAQMAAIHRGEKPDVAMRAAIAALLGVGAR